MYLILLLLAAIGPVLSQNLGNLTCPITLKTEFVRRLDKRALFCSIDGYIACTCFDRESANITMYLAARKIGYGVEGRLVALNGARFIGNISYNTLAWRRQSQEFVVLPGYFCFVTINYDWYLRLRGPDNSVAMRCTPCFFC
jgi:hypothetical protein